MLADLPLSPKQITSLRESTGRVNLWEGSIRSGKTLASLLRWLIYVATAPAGGVLIVVARTRDSAARNVFAPLQDAELFGPLAAQTRYTPGAPTGTILGRTVYVLGASDAKAEKVLRGLTVAGAYVDEATVIPEEFFTQLLGRMSVPGAQMFATTNPDNPAHWLKRKFLDRLTQLTDWRRFHFTLADNPSLTAAYLAAITAEFTGLWHRRFILGEWVAAEGAVYDMWDPEQHVVDAGQLPWMRRWLSLGVDYGTSNPSAALLLGLGADNRLYLVDEWRHDSRTAHHQLTDGEQSEQLRDWLRTRHRPGEQLGAVGVSPEWVYVDPAAASFKLQLWRDGLSNVADATNEVVDGIRTVSTLLARRRLLVSSSCAGWISEVAGYSWDPKASEKGEDKPIKTADHSLDGGRYAVASAAWLWQGQLDEGQEAA